MNITWTSRQGRERRYNSDAAAIGYAENYLIAIVVDAAEKVVGGRLIAGRNTSGKRLAQYWADSCLCELIASGVFKAEAEIVDFLHGKQKTLKSHYLHDSASYGLLVTNTKTSEFTWWFTGDCRIGSQSVDGDIEWLNTPHRMESQPLISAKCFAEAKEGLGDTLKHILPQSLNARRFYRPEKLSSKLPGSSSLVIATGGYWCEHLLGNTPWEKLEDDASLLTIKPGQRMLSLETGIPNLLVMYR